MHQRISSSFNDISKKITETKPQMVSIKQESLDTKSAMIHGFILINYVSAHCENWILEKLYK